MGGWKTAKDCAVTSLKIKEGFGVRNGLILVGMANIRRRVKWFTWDPANHRLQSKAKW